MPQYLYMFMKIIEERTDNKIVFESTDHTQILEYESSDS